MRAIVLAIHTPCSAGYSAFQGQVWMRASRPANLTVVRRHTQAQCAKEHACATVCQHAVAVPVFLLVKPQIATHGSLAALKALQPTAETSLRLTKTSLPGCSGRMLSDACGACPVQETLRAMMIDASWPRAFPCSPRPRTSLDRTVHRNHPHHRISAGRTTPRVILPQDYTHRTHSNIERLFEADLERHVAAHDRPLP